VTTSSPSLLILFFSYYMETKHISAKTCKRAWQSNVNWAENMGLKLAMGVHLLNHGQSNIIQRRQPIVKYGHEVGAYQSLQSIFQILWYPASCEYVDSHVYFCIHLVHVLATSAPTPSKCDGHVPCTRVDFSFSLLECAMIRCCYQGMLLICSCTEIDLSSIF
jgi:hypothetical protein